MKLAVALAAILLLVLQCPADVAAGDGFLNSDGLRKLFEAQRTITWKAARGTLRGVSEYHPDGTVLVAWNQPTRSGTDSGRWHIDHSSLCVKFKAVHGGRERCYRFKTISLKEYLAIDMDGNPAFSYFFE